LCLSCSCEAFLKDFIFFPFFFQGGSWPTQMPNDVLVLLRNCLDGFKFSRASFSLFFLISPRHPHSNQYPFYGSNPLIINFNKFLTSIPASPFTPFFFCISFPKTGDFEAVPSSLIVLTFLLPGFHQLMFFASHSYPHFHLSFSYIFPQKFFTPVFFPISLNVLHPSFTNQFIF